MTHSADITLIPTAELVADRRASVDDIGLCELGLKLGIQEQGGVKLKERARVNRAIVKKIDIELKRRLLEEERQAKSG